MSLSAAPLSAPLSPPLSPPNRAETPLRVVPIQKLLTAARWQLDGLRALPEAVFLWFTRGQGRLTMGGTTRGYGAHNGVILPAGVMHHIEFGALTQGVAVFFGTASTVTLPENPHLLRIRDAQTQGEVMGIIEQIQRELGSERIAAARAARHHIGLLSVWLERQIETASLETKRPNGAHRLAARYSAALEQGFRSGAGVAEFAAQLDVTPTHLTRACRETCGRSALDLLQDRRHYEACRLLAETEDAVKDISEALGFTSAAYFTRAFTAKTGKTPSDFRKSLK